jgi:hypothetical protein
MLTTAQRSKAQHNAYNNATHQRRQQRRQRNRQQPSTAFAQHSRVLSRSLCESGPRETWPQAFSGKTGDGLGHSYSILKKSLKTAVLPRAPAPSEFFAHSSFTVNKTQLWLRCGAINWSVHVDAGMRSSHADTAHSLSSPAQFKSEQSIEEGR